MQLSENYKRGVAERKAWMQAHPGATWAQATAAYAARRLAENAHQRAQDPLNKLTEAVRALTPTPAPAAPAKPAAKPTTQPTEAKLSDLTVDEFRARLDASFRTQLATSDGPSSPFWGAWAPEAANTGQHPLSPFWRGLDAQPANH